MARKKFTTTLDEDLISKIKIQAINEKTDVSKLLEKLIVKYLDDKKDSYSSYISSSLNSILSFSSVHLLTTIKLTI